MGPRIPRSLTTPRKLNVVGHVWWPHHRGGGGIWRRMTEAIITELAHPGGVAFTDDIDCAGGRPGLFDGPWVGIWHPPILPGRPEGLEGRLGDPAWAAPLANCRGLITLSPHTAAFLAARTGLPTCGLLHPADPPPVAFSAHRFRAATRPPLLMIGHSHRLVRPFFELHAPRFEKVLVQGTPGGYADEGDWAVNDSVAVVPRLPDEQYDDLLGRGVVFLDYRDTAANNVVVECIVRGTPILIRHSRAAEDYLGAAYPLFFDDPGEAAAKADDFGLILRAGAYLEASAIKPRLTLDYFLDSLARSEVYRDLPTPP